MSVACAEASAHLVWRECQQVLPHPRRLPAIHKPELLRVVITWLRDIQPSYSRETATHDLEKLVARLILLDARQFQGQRAFDKLGLPLNRTRIAARPCVLRREGVNTHAHEASRSVTVGCTLKPNSLLFFHSNPNLSLRTTATKT